MEVVVSGCDEDSTAAISLSNIRRGERVTSYPRLFPLLARTVGTYGCVIRINNVCNDTHRSKARQVGTLAAMDSDEWCVANQIRLSWRGMECMLTPSDLASNR
jgi:hypothetical protein